MTRSSTERISLSHYPDGKVDAIFTLEGKTFHCTLASDPSDAIIPAIMACMSPEDAHRFLAHYADKLTPPQGAGAGE